MRQRQKQFIAILLTLLVLMLVGFGAGYRLLPASRLAALFGLGQPLLSGALPFQTSQARAATTDDLPLDQLLLHNASLPAATLADWPEPATNAEPLALAESAGANQPDQDEPQLIIIEEEGAVAAQANASGPASTMPRIAVYCTHSSEEYRDSERIFGQHGGVHTVAEQLVTELNRLGLATVYCDTIHDAPDWNLSYVNSLQSAQALQAQYPGIEMFIDIHRDSTSDSILTTANGSLARMMLVVGSDERLEHPRWQHNLSFAEQLEQVLEANVAGISRGVRVHPGRYNQHLTDKSILVEMGSQANSVAEACASAQLLAQAISQLLP